MNYNIEVDNKEIKEIDKSIVESHHSNTSTGINTLNQPVNDSIITRKDSSHFTFNTANTKKLDGKGDLLSNASSTKSIHDMVNGVSDFIPLALRFPRKLWEKALEFYSKYNN